MHSFPTRTPRVATSRANEANHANDASHGSLAPSRRDRAAFRLFLINAAVMLAYLGAAKLGFLLASETKQVTAVWPPTGIAIFAMLRWGRPVWPAVWLAAFAANLTREEPLLTALGIACGNTLGPVFGTFLVQRVAHFDQRLVRVRDVLALVGLGAFVAMALTASNGVAWLARAGIVPWSAYFSVFWVWWVGDAMGVLIIATLLLTWSTPSEPKLTWSPLRVAELVCLFALLTLTSRLLFFRALPLTYAVFPFAVWAALRFGQRETALVMLIIAIAATWGIMHETGPFSLIAAGQRRIFLVIFLGVLAITALVLGAATSQRTHAERALHQAHDELERRVAERTEELGNANDNLKRANRELARRGRELAGKSDEVESFVYVVSHDLRAPLVNLQGFSEEHSHFKGGV